MAHDTREEERNLMVEYQIRLRGVGDERVLNAMRKIPRHKFVPESLTGAAYNDSPLPIGNGQTISQPYIVAVMTELLEVRATDRILEIGTGSGYQAAILGLLAAAVVSVERIPDVAAGAEKNLEKAGIRNVTVIVSDGTEGYPAGAPYDGILITAATPDIPAPLVDQLKDGGRLVAPVGSRDLQMLVKLKKHGSTVTRTSHGGVVFVPLIGRHGWDL